MTTATATARQPRKVKPKRFPYPTMPSDWFFVYVSHRDYPVDDAERAREAERVAQQVVRGCGAELSAAHREALYVHVRESVLGDWSALVALADLLSEADDFDANDRRHPATLALNTAARALELHLSKNTEYCAKRRRSPSSGGCPLRAYHEARSAASGNIGSIRDATLAFIADRMRHGEE